MIFPNINSQIYNFKQQNSNLDSLNIWINYLIKQGKKTLAPSEKIGFFKKVEF